MISAKLTWWLTVSYITLVALGSLGFAWLNAAKDRELGKFQADSSVQIEQAKREAAQANERASAADARAAEANALAKQTELELAKLRQPRTIPQDRKHRIIEKLSESKGQVFELAANAQDREAISFLIELANMLVEAGWKAGHSQLGNHSMFLSRADDSTLVVNAPIYANIGTMVIGWQTGTDERNDEATPNVGKRMKAAVDLVNSLTNAGLSSEFKIQDSRSFRGNRNAIRVEVGRKP